MSHFQVTPDDLRRLARLARLQLEEDEVQGLCRDLGSVISYMALLADPSSSAPARDQPGGTPSGDSLQGRMRDDMVTPSLPRDEVLAQAPEVDSEGFVVAPPLPRAGR